MLTLIIFLVAFVTLSLWFLFKENKEVRSIFGKTFLGSFGLYLATVFLMPGVDVSWTSFAMNLVFLFGGGFFLNTFSSSKIIFVPMLFLMTMGYYYGVRGIDWFPFGTVEETSVVEKEGQAIPEDLDQNAELLIEVSNGHQLNELNSILETYNLTAEPAFTVQDAAATELDDFYAVNIPENQMENYHAIFAALDASNLVDHIEGNEILSLDPMEATATERPAKKNKYTANDPEVGKVWGYEAMDFEALYQLLITENIKPVKKARIAIIDTGVDMAHEDLNEKFVSLGDYHNDDPHGHGTHCAGIAAAVSNNGKGIASFAPNNDYVEVTSVKVFGKYGSTSQRIIIDGMLLAVDNGADVLSMSLGGPGTPSRQRAYKQAVKYANKKGALVVVAAGNESIDARKRVPASVDGVITVSALDEGLNKASFSNSVEHVKMGIAAPGKQVYSTIPNNSYEYFNGTSMATPYVAGLLGLMKSIEPSLNTQEAYKILKQTGKDTRNTKVTGKLINPATAVNQLLKK